MYRVDLSVESNYEYILHTAASAGNETDGGHVDNTTYVSRKNESQYSMEDEEFIFDRTDVRAIFITLYTIVFCCCFFGKLANTSTVFIIFDVNFIIEASRDAGHKV